MFSGIIMDVCGIILLVCGNTVCVSRELSLYDFLVHVMRFYEHQQIVVSLTDHLQISSLFLKIEKGFYFQLPVVFLLD